MEKKQVADNGMIVGIDIGRSNVQISTLPIGAELAETISTRVGEEKYEIPLCLYKRKDSETWDYGEKARENMRSDEGVYIDDLWEGSLAHREILLEESTYSYSRLLCIFIKKLFSLLSQAGCSQEIQALVFTTESLDHKRITQLVKIARNVPVDFKRIFFVDYKESFGAYATRGRKELWNHEVFLFYYTGRNLKAFDLRVNQKRLPFQMKIEEMDYGEVEYCREELEDSEEARADLDGRFQATIQELFAKRVVSCVYLIGEGFQPGWTKASLRLLCRGRRVFQGNNLFTKGACYAGEWYLGLQKPPGEYKSSQLLGCDIRIPVLNGERGRDYVYAAKEGEPWYHAGMETVCRLEELSSEQNQNIQIEILSHSTKNVREAEKREILEFVRFPNRPEKASKVHIRVDFPDEYTGRIRVKDMGMGEFFPSSGLSWEKQFQIKEKAAYE